MKRTLTKNDISIQHFFKKYKDADFDDPAVRDYILEYFVDRIYIYDDEIVITSWYGDDRREISWSDLDFEITRSKSSKSSRACESGPPPTFQWELEGFFVSFPLSIWTAFRLLFFEDTPR